jgi:transketolase
MGKTETGLKDWLSKQSCYNFRSEELSRQTLEKFEELGNIVRGDILTMTTVANSGHPGGAMSSADIYIVIYSLANVHPLRIENPNRDRIIVSHGHTSAGCYSILGRLGFFNIEDALTQFRKCGSPFEGHIEREVPGCEWSTGNLGQGLSAGCGFALGSKIFNRDNNIFVLMGDAEQAKGQVAEARRFAKKFELNNITVLIDYNQIQISGSTHKVMNVNVKENYESDGWKVIETDGHNFEDIYKSTRKSIQDTSAPYAIICHTTMGKSVSFMEEAKEYYHGRPLPPDKCGDALKEIGIENKIELYAKKRESTEPPKSKERTFYKSLNIETGKSLHYTTSDKLGNRDAFGKALENIATINKDNKKSSPIVAFDCDLKESVRTYLFEKATPLRFFEGGVQEHNTATVAGALSTEPVLVFFADFGVFGMDEVYNQQRLNAINHTNLKVVITHAGINVGEDGKTHHCIDFLGLARNLPGFKVIIPADPNQTDRVIRWAAKKDGNYLIATGRVKNPIIADTKGHPLFDGDYAFKYGNVDIVRKGKKGIIMTYGPSLVEAIRSWEQLKQSGVEMDIWNISCPLALTKEDIEKALFKGPLFTFEDHLVYTGLGNIVGNFIAESGMGTVFKKIGVQDFSPSGTSKDLYKTMKIDSESLTKIAKKTLQ